MTAALSFSPVAADPARAANPARRPNAALDEAIRRVGRLAPATLDTRPPLPVAPALGAVLPHGLRRGNTVAVAGGVASTSLTLALVGAASAAGSWCTLVGLPPLTAEGIAGFGLDLRRLAVIPAAALTPAGWTTAVGALLDAVDVVVVRPPARLPDGDVRRLLARARSRGAVLLVVTAADRSWPGADVRLQAEHVSWSGIVTTSSSGAVPTPAGVTTPPAGYGRLRARQVTVTGVAKGRSSRPTRLWLPSRTGGVEAVPPTASLTALRQAG